MESVPDIRRRHWGWWILGLGVLIAVSAASILAFVNQPARVTVTQVVSKTLEDKIFATGTVKPIQRQLVMPTQLPSPVESVKVSVGDTVKAGQLLMVCRDAVQKASLDAAETAVQQAQNTVDETVKEQQQAPPGMQAQFIGTLASARSSLAQAQANLQQAQAAYDATQIRADVAGMVVALNPEGVAADGSSAPVLEVVGGSKRIVTQVSEVDAVRIKQGMTADLTSDAFPNQNWTAVVERVSPFAAATGSGTAQVEVDLTVDGAFPVPLGFSVNVHIVTATHKGVPVIPYSALVQDGDNYVVYTIRNGRAVTVNVSLGITTDTDVEVKKGLTPGERIIVNPPANLSAGEAVRSS